MGHPRRYFENNCAYFITNRLASGLPFVPCEYVNNVIKGILAKANTKYPNINICNYLWMRNHYHMLIVTNGNPADIANFMNILNGELAKAVAIWLGKKNIKVWGQRYNCLRLLTPEDVIEKVAYLYLNPVTANFVDKVCRWPGVSSYGIEKEEDVVAEYLKPSILQRLPKSKLTMRINEVLISNSREGKKFKMTIKPFAWVECFEDSESIEFYKIQISNKIGLEETKLEQKRKYPVMGALECKQQNPHQIYIPRNRGKRMFCMSSCLELRKQFIELYKDFCERCILTWKSWQKGNLGIPYPSGGFLPPRHPLSSVLKFQT